MRFVQGLSNHGRCFLHWRIGHVYQPERWSHNTFTSITQDEEYPEVEVCRKDSILDTKPSSCQLWLTSLEVQKQDLLRSKHYRGKEFSTASDNVKTG